MTSLPGFSDPGGTCAPRLDGTLRMVHAYCTTKTSHNLLLLSGLNRQALKLAVYASSWLLPSTTQDSLPGVG